MTQGPDGFEATCFMCGKRWQFGPHRYPGKHIARYQITVCEGCYAGNWDGWNPRCEARLLSHLAENGIPVPLRNEAGWFPRE